MSDTQTATFSLPKIHINQSFHGRRYQMLMFACKDAGVNCSFIANGNTIEEVKQEAFAHAEIFHKDILQSMTPEQMEELAKTVEENIRPA
jgi:predicted small metal-binding protein